MPNAWIFSLLLIASPDDSRLSSSRKRAGPPLASLFNFGPTILKELPDRSPEYARALKAERKATDTSHLLSFYGNDCEMCEYMVQHIKRVEKELGTKVRRFETWSNPQHEKLRAVCDSRSGCGGVPFFYNKESGRWICGATTYDNLKRWASGKPCAPFLPPPTSFKSQQAPKEPAGAMRMFSDLRERGKEAMEERQKLAEEQRAIAQAGKTEKRKR